MSKEPQSGARNVRRACPAMVRSRRIACWRGGWRSAACASSSSTIATGIITAAVKPGIAYQGRRSRPAHRGADHRSRSSAACSTTRWWSGAVNSDAPPCRRAATAAITTSRASRTCWPAAASKPGSAYGTTDELGYAAEENPVSVHDFHATMLHLLGVDHKRLAVKFQGLDVRLTGISGDVVKDILI